MALNEYELYNLKHKRGSFTQSLMWTDVKKNWKYKTVVVRNSLGDVTAGALLLIRKFPLMPFTFMYIPRGPLWNSGDRASLARLFEKIKTEAKRYRCFLIKADPQIDENDSECIAALENLGFEYHGERVGYETVQCRENYILDIRKRSPQELFDSFKPKCRYNIRLAKRKGVECVFFGMEKFEEFYSLLLETAQRDGFEVRSGEYYRRILTAFGDRAKLCMCYKDEVPLSAALYIEYGNRATYLVGASSNDKRNLMPNYLMQWTMIESACENNLDIYDFGGIPYWYDENHRNYGVYRFKKQFSGEVKVYAGEFDYVVSKGIYAFLKRFI